MANKNNIEELFQDSFQNFEAPVDPSVWEAVNSQINSGAGAGSSASGSTTSGGGMSAAKVAIISSAVVGSVTAGVVIGYNLQSDDSPKENKIVQEPEEKSSEEPNVVEYPEYKEITEQPVPEEDPSKAATTTPQKEEYPTKNEYSDPKKDLNGDKQDNQTTTNQSKYDPDRSIPKSGADDFLSEPDKTYYTETEQRSEDVVDNKTASSHNRDADKTENSAQATTEPLTAAIQVSAEGGPAPHSVELEANTNGEVLSWNFGDGVETSYPNPKHIYKITGEYTVTLTVEDKAGNQKTASTIIRVYEGSELKMPNIFTPNGDNRNDVYLPETAKRIDSYSMRIIDINTGKTLFETNSIDAGWNGNDRFGNPVPEGNYICVVNARGKDQKTYNKKLQIKLVRSR